MSRPDTSASLSGGGSAATAAQVFRKMDNDNNGALDFSEMLQALKELGVLDGIQAGEASKVLQKELKEADTDHNGLIDFQEFQHYFQRMALYQQNEARKQRLRRKGAPSGADRNLILRDCFRHFCQYGKAHIIGAGSMTNASLDSLRMNSRQFLRLCKEVGFTQPSGQLEHMTVDVIFAQCKVAGDRSISFKGFLEAFAMIAENLEAEFEDLLPLISSQIQPSKSEKASSPIATPRKSSTLKRPSTPSIVAQTWKKQSNSAAGDANLPPQTARSWAASSEESKRVFGGTGQEDLHKLLRQAQEEGAQRAAAEWDEERQHLHAHIQQLQDLIATLQSSDDNEQKGPVQRQEEQRRHNKDSSKHITREIEALKASIMEDLQERIGALGRQTDRQEPGGLSSETAVNKLRLQVVQLEDVVSHLQETHSSFNSTGSGTLGMSVETAPAADLEEALEALEMRALDRQKRLEAAMLQIATKVDALEQRLDKAL